MSRDDVRGPWREGVEMGPRFFEGVNTFADILNMFSDPALARLPEANPYVVVQARTAFESGEVVSSELIRAVPEKYGMQEAVVRALAPNFEQDDTFAIIINRLLKTDEQNKQLIGFFDSKKQPLAAFKTSEASGSVPINVPLYIQQVKTIESFLNNPDNPRHADAYDMVDNSRFTSSGGFKDAVKRAVLTVLARASEKTAPIPLS